jgi:hypothetical protein
VTWSIAGGELPAGIALDSTGGTLSGTPTAAGFHRLVLRAVDEDGRTATREFVLAVNRDRSFAIMAHSEILDEQYTASVRELTGGHPGDLIDVTPRIGGFMRPDAFSPGGTWASITAADGAWLYLVDLRSDLQPARLLTTHLQSGRLAPARFSPDDAFVAWAVESPPGSFRFTWNLSDLRGAAPVTVASIPDAGYDLAWSPDGRKLFVTSATGQALHVWDGTAVNDVALPAPLRAFSELWAPDSSALVMVANGGGAERTYLVPIDGSLPPLPLTPSGLFLNGNFLTSSPDGATVLVADTFFGDPTSHHLAIDLRGTQPAQASMVTDRRNMAMAWSLDSTQLMITYDLFLSPTLGSMAVIARDAIGAAVPTPVDLSASGGVVEWGHWSADGQYFGYAAPQGLVELPVRTAGTPRLITPDDIRDIDWQSLSPRRRAYVVVHGGVSLSFVDLAQADAQVLRIDSDDTAPTGPSADWRLASQLPAVEWATYVTAPHTVRMSDLSASIPGPSTLLLAFGTGVVTTLITP